MFEVEAQARVRLVFGQAVAFRRPNDVTGWQGMFQVLHQIVGVIGNMFEGGEARAGHLSDCPQCLPDGGVKGWQWSKVAGGFAVMPSARCADVSCPRWVARIARDDQGTERR